MEEANKRAEARRRQLEADISTELRTLELDNERILKRAELEAEDAKAKAAERKALLDA